MKFVVGESGRTPKKTYSDSDSSISKPTWSDWDANSWLKRVGGVRLTACDTDAPSYHNKNEIKISNIFPQVHKF